MCAQDSFEWIHNHKNIGLHTIHFEQEHTHLVHKSYNSQRFPFSSYIIYNYFFSFFVAVKFAFKKDLFSPL